LPPLRKKETMSASHTFQNEPAPPLNEKFVEKIHQICPETFLVCFRSKNKNVVVYQLNSVDGKVAPEAVKGYWLVMDQGKDYMPYRRRRNIRHDREELSYLDRKFAWGFKSKKVNDSKAEFSFNNFPFPMTILYQNGEAKLFLKIEDEKKTTRKFFVRSLYIDASDNLNLFNVKDNMKSLHLNTLEVTNPSQPQAKKIEITKDQKFVIKD